MLAGEPARGRRGPEKAASNRRGVIGGLVHSPLEGGWNAVGMVLAGWLEGGWNGKFPVGRRLEGVSISSSPSHPRALAEAHPSHLRPLAEVP